MEKHYIISGFGKPLGYTYNIENAERYVRTHAEAKGATITTEDPYVLGLVRIPKIGVKRALRALFTQRGARYTFEELVERIRAPRPAIFEMISGLKKGRNRLVIEQERGVYRVRH